LFGLYRIPKKPAPNDTVGSFLTNATMLQISWSGTSMARMADPDFWCAFEEGKVKVIGDEPANNDYHPR
jgi:hypothetical protein